MAQWFLEDVVAQIRPDLEQVLLACIVEEDGRVDDFDENGAKSCSFVVLAAGDNFVKFVKRDRIHDFLHELLGRSALVLVQLVLLVMFKDILQLCILECLFVLLLRLKA